MSLHLHVAIALENFWYRLNGNPFRAFIHPPQHMASLLEAAGFVCATRRESLAWGLDLYYRSVLGSAVRS